MTNLLRFNANDIHTWVLLQQTHDISWSLLCLSFLPSFRNSPSVRALVVAFHMIPIGASARTSLGYPDPAYVLLPLFPLLVCKWLFAVVLGIYQIDRTIAGVWSSFNEMFNFYMTHFFLVMLSCWRESLMTKIGNGRKLLCVGGSVAVFGYS